MEFFKNQETLLEKRFRVVVSHYNTCLCAAFCQILFIILVRTNGFPQNKTPQQTDIGNENVSAEEFVKTSAMY